MAALSQSNGPHPTSLSLDRLSRSVNPRVCPVTNTRGASLTVTPGSASLSICSSFSTLFSQFQFPSRSTSTEILELTRLESSKSLVGLRRTQGRVRGGPAFQQCWASEPLTVAQLPVRSGSVPYVDILWSPTYRPCTCRVTFIPSISSLYYYRWRL